ncbi:MAG: magnesium transport protein CorA [Oligoflexia bacterium]|nr:MAG: magnesium transport protein CorA [Oligoflexia bacterium]
MRRTIFEHPTLKWLDLSHPSKDELDAVQREFKLHPILVQDCADPIHLPKYEKNGNITFIIVRIYDVDASPGADTVVELTRKVAIFFGPGFVITVHRLDPEYFQSLVDRCVAEVDNMDAYSHHNVPIVLVKFINRALRSYNIPLEKGEDDLDLFETALFSTEASLRMFQELHTVRRRLSLIKRILLHSQDVIQRLSPPGETSSPLFQDLRENIANYIFLTDELLEDTTSLLSLQISLASQKTNDVMRVLTIFSVFFMPLTFIVGVYGMNFPNMPEMRWEYGYLIVWVAMIATTLAIGLWFYRKGWLKSE